MRIRPPAAVCLIAASGLLCSSAYAQTAMVQRVFASPSSSEVQVALSDQELSEMNPITSTAFPGTPVGPDKSGARSVFYRFAPPKTGGQLTLVGSSDRSAFTLSLYDSEGTPLVSTYTPGPEQRLLLGGGSLARIVEVTLENPADDVPGVFRLTLTSGDGSPADGYAYRLAVLDTEYQDFVAFGGCDTADSRQTCSKSCDSCDGAYSLIRRAIGPAAATSRQPVIAFVGISGVNQIILAHQPGDKSMPRHYRSLASSQ